MKPWRQVAEPHEDVASGRYQQAEFAADLWQVYRGEGASEYVDPVEFFRRTYLTEALREMLVGGIRRLSGNGGDPVMQLQTNFGGGKTHSMLALYHLFSGVDPSELENIDSVRSEARATSVPRVKRVVLVGNKISPGNPDKRDGTLVRTLWGELAWQLGGASAYRRIALDDENATSPGDALRILLKEYGPCLILIDEWVAYARQLHDQSDLPGGSFETQFTFAQALTEAVKAVDNCLLVVSLPASDTAVSPHLQQEDIEVGGQRGHAALNRLRNVVGRIESSWRPASADEGFEIVRRRLFKPFAEPEQFTSRDVTARHFADLYRRTSGEFPPECRERAYEKRIQDAYPIHPEVFDRLYTEWSTIARFQRTRGVLRLMAGVIHNLWERGDTSPLILPSSLAIEERQVLTELTRYLPDNWEPIIQKDVGGSQSLPVRIDGAVSSLGKYSACRRVARTVYLGSAPAAHSKRKGVDAQRIKLGCVLPGEPHAVYGDALRRLVESATYLYQDGNRFWYDVRPTVTKLATDRAEQLRREPDRVRVELERQLTEALKDRGGFSRIHVAPQSGSDVADEEDTRLVVLGVDHVYHKDPDSQAEAKAREILESRGKTPRQFRNTLVFLAPDQSLLADLDEAVRRFMAWRTILDESDLHSLTKDQRRQAQEQLKSSRISISARIPETYKWLLVPEQEAAQSPVTLGPVQLRGRDSLAARAAKYLINEELMVATFAGTRLRMELDRIPLWSGDHVEVRQLREYFASYPYLQRFQRASVLDQAIVDGVGGLTCDDTFAYADSWSEEQEKYLDLQIEKLIRPEAIVPSGLVVKPEAARKSQPKPKPPLPPPIVPPLKPPPVDPNPRRFFGTVQIDPGRSVRDVGQIFDEILCHLTKLSGAEVTVELEIEAQIPEGVPEATVRTVVENCNSLRFKNHGFSRE